MKVSLRIKIKNLLFRQWLTITNFMDKDLRRLRRDERLYYKRAYKTIQVEIRVADEDNNCCHRHCRFFCEGGSFCSLANEALLPDVDISDNYIVMRCDECKELAK